MKLTVRFLALGIAITGAAAGFAASHSDKTPSAMLSHQAVSTALPPAICFPSDPTGCGIQQ